MVLISDIGCVPDLSDGTRHKGQNGKVLVIGGCFIYTGAPYFVAQSALYSGCDYVYIATSGDATLSALKAMSPDFIVTDVEKLRDYLSNTRIDVITLGNGIGAPSSSEYGCNFRHTFDLSVDYIVKRKIPAVIDADGLSWIAHQGAECPLLSCDIPMVWTPNSRELERLQDALGPLDQLFFNHKNLVIVCKGQTDRIMFSDGTSVCEYRVDVPSSQKRCSGQGDILVGIIASMLARCDDVAVACAAACTLTRYCACRAGAKYNYGLTSRDILEELHGFSDLALIDINTTQY